MLPVKPSQLFRAINGLFDCKLAPMIWGPPGIGKSDIVHQVAEHRAKRTKGYEMRDVRLGLMDPTDIKGFPAPDLAHKQMFWLPPSFLPTKGCGVLFLDEINTAPPAVQASAYQLVLNRQVGDYKLPDGWDVCAAGNGQADRAVTYTMGSALASRLIHLFLEVDNDEWTQWADANGISLSTIAFMKFRKNLLHNFNPNVKSHAFPCPRTWAFADKIIQHSGLIGDDLRSVLQGTVGEGAAGEYLAFLPVMQHLPDIDTIRKSPMKVPVPSDISVLYATITMISRSTTEKEFPALMKYIERCPRDFQMAYIKEVLTRVSQLDNHPTYKDWAMKNIDLVSV